MDGWVPKMWFCCLPKELELHWNVYLQSCYKWFMRCLYLNVTADSCQELFLPWHHFSHCSFSFFFFKNHNLFVCLLSYFKCEAFLAKRACMLAWLCDFWEWILCWYDLLIGNSLCVWVSLAFMRSLSGFLYFCNFIITDT